MQGRTPKHLEDSKGCPQIKHVLMLCCQLVPWCPGQTQPLSGQALGTQDALDGGEVTHHTDMFLCRLKAPQPSREKW